MVPPGSPGPLSFPRAGLRPCLPPAHPSREYCTDDLLGLSPKEAGPYDELSFLICKAVAEVYPSHSNIKVKFVFLL